MNISEIISVLADAREKRAEIKKQISLNGFASVSVSLNIPSYPKSSVLYESFFNVILSEIMRFLSANRIFIDIKNEVKITDEAGCFYTAPLIETKKDILPVKELCEKFEEEHKTGRIIDIDIFDKQNNPVSSNKAKLCIFCNEKPALVCMHEKSHSYDEIRKLINFKIENYLYNKRKDEVCRQLSSIALKSILYEVSLTPKPGLVDRTDSGIHKDMSFYTFLNSSSVISSFFKESAIMGYEFADKDLSSALPIIRVTGLKAEKEMFEETGGVNTQKGIIFLMGLSLFSSAKTISDFKRFKAKEFRKILTAVTKSLKNEFSPNTTDKTHGEICKEKYGNLKGGGVKQEAVSGFETVFKFGLPEIKKHNLSDLSEKKDIDFALISTLLALMAKNNDTNILYRSNLETLKELKDRASTALKYIKSETKLDRYIELIQYCLKKNISPGGSADLLAVTTFLYFTESKFTNNNE